MKFLKYISLILIVVLFAGCISVKYDGPTFPQTQHVKIFYSKDHIKVPYTEMGKATAETWYPYRKNAMKKAIIEKARNCGADAVLVENIDVARKKYVNSYENVASGKNNGLAYGLNSEENIYVNAENNKNEATGAKKVVVTLLKFSKQ